MGRSHPNILLRKHYEKVKCDPVAADVLLKGVTTSRVLAIDPAFLDKQGNPVGLLQFIVLYDPLLLDFSVAYNTPWKAPTGSLLLLFLYSTKVGVEMTGGCFNNFPLLEGVRQIYQAQCTVTCR